MRRSSRRIKAAVDDPRRCRIEIPDEMVGGPSLWETRWWGDVVRSTLDGQLAGIRPATVSEMAGKWQGRQFLQTHLGIFVPCKPAVHVARPVGTLARLVGKLYAADMEEALRKLHHHDQPRSVRLPSDGYGPVPRRSSTLSLDAAIGTDASGNSLTLMDVLCDASFVTQADADARWLLANDVMLLARRALDGGRSLAIFRDRLFGGMTWEALAGKHGISARTVRSIYARDMKAVRQAVAVLRR